jgi:hypothetical protein
LVEEDPAIAMEAAAQRRRVRLLPQALRLFAWICAAALAFVAAFALTLWLVGPVEGLLPGAGAGTLVHGITLAAHVVVWGALTAGSTAALASVLYGREAQVDRRALYFVLTGIAVAGVTELALHEWARDRFGVFSPEHVGSLSLPAAVLVVSTLGFAARIAPRYAVRLLNALLAIPILWVLVIASGNVPGALDGISWSAVPLALSIVGATAFSLYAGAATLHAR